MLEALLQPLQYPFMLRGMTAAVLVGVVCAILGCYVVLRGMAFFGDALAHAILPGLAVGYLVGGGAREPLFWWAMGTAVVSSLGIGAVSRNARIKEDTAIGIIFAGMFALGIALISSVRSYTVDLAHFLFGDVLGVGAQDLILTAIFGGLVLLVVFLFYKEFMVLAFDPVLAATLRLPARLLDNILIVLIAVAIVVSLQTVGVALTVAMLVTPASYRLFTHAPPVEDDGAGCGHRRPFGRGGAIFVLLPQHCLRRRHRAHLHGGISGGVAGNQPEAPRTGCGAVEI